MAQKYMARMVNRFGENQLHTSTTNQTQNLSHYFKEQKWRQYGIIWYHMSLLLQDAPSIMRTFFFWINMCHVNAVKLPLHCIMNLCDKFDTCSSDSVVGAWICHSFQLFCQGSCHCICYLLGASTHMFVHSLTFLYESCEPLISILSGCGGVSGQDYTPIACDQTQRHPEMLVDLPKVWTCQTTIFMSSLIAMHLHHRLQLQPDKNSTQQRR